MLELRVSGDEFPGVDALAAALQALGVEASIWPTANVCKTGSSFRIERGAVVELHGGDRRRFAEIWPSLKKACSASCGHVTERQVGFRGCTENYVRETACPHATGRSLLSL